MAGMNYWWVALLHIKLLKHMPEYRLRGIQGTNKGGSNDIQSKGCMSFKMIECLTSVKNLY
jgi:hypothetical protein